MERRSQRRLRVTRHMISHRAADPAAERRLYGERGRQSQCWRRADQAELAQTFRPPRGSKPACAASSRSSPLSYRRPWRRALCGEGVPEWLARPEQVGDPLHAGRPVGDPAGDDLSAASTPARTQARSSLSSSARKIRSELASSPRQARSHRARSGSPSMRPPTQPTVAHARPWRFQPQPARFEQGREPGRRQLEPVEAVLTQVAAPASRASWAMNAACSSHPPPDRP